MCYNCGCGVREDDMGDAGNITELTFKDLAQKLGKDVHETKHYLLTILELYVEQKKDVIKGNKNIELMFDNASKAWGQDREVAIKETYKLLKKSHNH